MKHVRKKIPTRVREKLVQDAGGKCANPGCLNTRTQIHHIKEWHVYHSDDPKILLPVCPTCHDSIHHGRFKPTEEELYSWKGIKAENCDPVYAHLCAQPSKINRVVAGSVGFATKNIELTLFRLSSQSFLKFQILDEDKLLIDLAICDRRGRIALRMSQNYLTVHNTDQLSLDHMPGRIVITAQDIGQFLDPDYVRQMRNVDPNYQKTPDQVLLDMQITKPGHVTMRGIWATNRGAFICTDKVVALTRKGNECPITFVGDGGEESVLLGDYKSGQPMFAF